MNGLRLYSRLRSWTPIPKAYAKSKSTRIKQSYQYSELYLDAWPDKLGVRLKLQARLGCLWWRHQPALHAGLASVHGHCNL